MSVYLEPQGIAGRVNATANDQAKVIAAKTDTVRSGKAFRRWLGINGPIKRCFDIAASAVGLLLLLPLFLTIALAIRLEGPGSVLFRQHRVGRNGRSFAMLKFRSMHADAGARLRKLLANCPEKQHEWNTFQKLKDDPRVTRVGRFIRKTSLDELPQLLNVLLGHMSLVGPRPILPEQRQTLGEHLGAYEASRPGITGLWQVRGRNDLPFEARARLGSEYLESWSIGLDLKILIETIPAVLNGRTS